MPGKQRKRQGNSGTSRSPRRNHGSSSKAAASKVGAVGSDPRAVKLIGGKGDFGVPETGQERDRQYVSQETKSQDPGGMPPHAGVDQSRVAGVGGNESGVGSSSSGDIDPDIVGVGTGGSTISQAGPDDRKDGADMVTSDKLDQSARDRNSRQAAQKNPTQPRGTYIDRTGDITTHGGGDGSAAATDPLMEENDAFAGELSLDDVSAVDNSPQDRA
ncbi:MAG: hypothetical protein H7Z14_09005 [Anaerolineae bacterium]|nr:hypothetical protein [Phycisphaerae bacterium]